MFITNRSGERRFVMFGNGPHCPFRHRKEIMEDVPRAKYLLHPEYPSRWGIKDDELESGDIITKYYDRVDELIFLNNEQISFIIILKDIFGNDTPLSLEFEVYTTKIKELQKELESLRNESYVLNNELDKLRNKPSEWLIDKTRIFDEATLIRKKEEEEETEEENIG